MKKTIIAAVATAAGLLVAAAPAHADDQDDMFVEMLEQQYGITMDSDAAADIASALRVTRRWQASAFTTHSRHYSSATPTTASTPSPLS